MDKKKMCKILVGIGRVFRVIGLIAIVLVAIGFPFVLDFLYGNGMLTWYDNAFPGEVWFSFIGSYFPATIVGMLSLYQAYIIQRQEKQYKKLLGKHRFIPAGQAKVHRYKSQTSRIGIHSFYDINERFVRNLHKTPPDEWASGYILESEVYSLSGIGIKRADVKKVKWEIDDKVYVQDRSEMMVSTIKRVSYSQQQIIIYWIFDQCEDINDLVIRCMLNDSRHDSRYDLSAITVMVQIIDDEGIRCDLEMRFVMKAQEDDYHMSSIEEYYLCEVM